MRLKNALASIALAGMVVAQPAAAATRSADSLPSAGLQVGAVERIGAAIGETDEQRRGFSPVLIILLAFGISLGLVVLLAGGDDSPGA